MLANVDCFCSVVPCGVGDASGLGTIAAEAASSGSLESKALPSGGAPDGTASGVAVEVKNDITRGSSEEVEYDECVVSDPGD